MLFIPADDLHLENRIKQDAKTIRINFKPRSHVVDLEYICTDARKNQAYLLFRTWARL